MHVRDRPDIPTARPLARMVPMIKVSKRFVDRARTNLRRYQKILESARSRDVNESDTAVIVSDFLADVLGYSKYEEITTEFAVRSTFCDLAIKLGGQVHFLIEVKSIGTALRDNHLRQAVDYGAHHGIEWVLLTNGVEWHSYRIRFEQPIAWDLVFSIDLLDPLTKPAQLLEKLYLISREASSGTEIEQYLRRQEATSRYVIGQVLLSDAVLSVVRRQLRSLFPGLKVSGDELGQLIEGDVLKRDVVEGDRAVAAQRRVRRASRRRERKAAAASAESATVPIPVADARPIEAPVITP